MFKSIKAINFFSWDKLEFNLQSGVTLLSGDEGAGKSSIPNALCWGLYGELPKDTNIDDVVMNGKETCVVEIELEDGTIIVRSRKPNQLYIQNGSTVDKGSDAKETQKIITSLIGMSFHTFCSSVYFAQNYPGNFITASQEDKAKILSELQDLSIFDRATKKSNDSFKIAKNDLSVASLTLGYKQKALEAVKNEYDTFVKLSDNYHEDKLKVLNQIIQRNDVLFEEINKVKEEANDINNLDSIPDHLRAIEETRTALANIQQTLFLIDNLRKQKETVLNTLNCPTCGQNLPDSGCEEILIPDDTELLKKEAFHKEELVTLNEEYTQLREKNNKNNILKEKLSGLIRERTQLSTEILQIEGSTNPHLTKIEQLIFKLEESKKDLQFTMDKESGLIKKISDLEFLKDGFKEIKSHVFQSLLTELNSRTNYYLRSLFEESRITFHNISEEGSISKIQTIVNIEGQDRSLGLLSGGQARRVQLAVDFALSDIVSQRSNNPINLRILDESFKDLSPGSMSKLIDILQQMKGTTILIEHNDIVKGIVNNIVEVEIKDGCSRIK